MSNKYSKRLIREWTGYHKVGIWDNCRWSVRLYADRAVYKDYTVRWCNTSGLLIEKHERWTGGIVNQLKKIAAEEKEDNADYTEKVYWEIVREII